MPGAQQGRPAEADLDQPELLFVSLPPCYTPAMDTLLTRDDVARILGVSRDHFDIMRRRGDGPPETKLGHRIVRFRPQDVDAWVISRQNAA